MRKILILMFAILLYGLNADVKLSNVSLDSNTTSMLFTQKKLLKKELENGNTTYRSQELNINVISHPAISDTDKAYIDYIFFTNQHNLGNVRFYNTDNFGDLGNTYYFHNNRSKFALIEYLDESLEIYYFLVDLTDIRAKKIFEQSYGNTKYSTLKYTPEKLLNQDKHLPITYAMFENDGGLYLKVGTTYKSDIITLKKSNSGK